MMNAKYFTAPKQDECISQAEGYFQVARDQLYCRFMMAEESGGALLLAIKPDEGGYLAVENMDSFYTLSFIPEGVLLEIFPAQGQGKPLNVEALDSYLQRKDLKNYDKEAKENLLRRGWGYAYIAPAQEERMLDQEALITLERDESAAYLTILPGDEGFKPLDEEAVWSSIKAAGITHGVDDEAIQYLLHERDLYKKYLVASATPPQRGADGYLQFHFRREFSGRPREEDDGRVDYRMLDLFESVNEGQALITRVSALPGVPGRTITGREIPAEPGKNVAMPGGKNVILSEEGAVMRAAVSGMVVYTGTSVNVSTVYHISDNADMKVGNIDFDGSIVISGNVISGLTIKASGNIEIGGVVEGSTIISGGNIVLRRGMQGMGKGMLQAAGNITANYIERTTVLAGGCITANTISHSMVEAGDSLYLSGKNGSLVGGSARVSNIVSAQIIGSPMEIATEVEVGLVPHKRERINFLQLELKRLSTEIEKLSTIVDYLDRNPTDDIKKVSMRFTVGQSLQHNTQLLAEYTEELERLTEESTTAVHGKVHVSNAVYPGGRLTIASAVYRVESFTEHCTFRVSDGEVVMGAYER